MDALADNQHTEAVSNGLANARRLVIKVGSSLLFDHKTATLNQSWLSAITEDLTQMRARGQEIIIVSSGAIALGRHKLGLQTQTLRLEESQAAAAAGQIDLINAWSTALSGSNTSVAQILLTLTDTEDRRRYLNARTTLQTLLKLGTIPIINENDTVATTEIRYGDNDRLAARVAGMVSADWLVLLSDIDGLYTNDPKTNENARFISRVDAITPDILALAAKPPPKNATQLGSGGMVTKLEAARIAMNAGCHALIADGRKSHPLKSVEGGGRSTWFIATATPTQSRKHWIAGSLATKGTLTIDAGAAKALKNGMSLLPAGVKSVSGLFSRGDAVSVKDINGEEIARGLCAYDTDAACAIMGQQSKMIKSILGYAGREEMIHRDDLALLDTNSDTAKSNSGGSQ